MPVRLVLAIAIGFVSTAAAAQSTDVGITLAGVIALQPVDEAYVGSPYLSEGIGGISPGVGAGVSAILPRGLTIAAEYSRAFFSRDQSGRLVPGPRPPGPGGPSIGGSGTTHLADSLLSALIGYTAGGTGQTRAAFLAGVALRLDDPIFEHAAGDTVVEEDDDAPLALTGGVDVLQSLSARVTLIGGVRYTYIERGEQHQFLGIGPHVLRGSVGLRFRLN